MSVTRQLAPRAACSVDQLANIGAPSTLTSSVGEIITSSSLYWPSEGFFRLALPQWHSVHKVLDFGRAATRDRAGPDLTSVNPRARAVAARMRTWFKQLQVPVPVTAHDPARPQMPSRLMTRSGVACHSCSIQSSIHIVQAGAQE